MCSKENCGYKKNFGLEKFWAKKILFPKKKFVSKNFGSKKENVGPKKVLVKNSLINLI